MDLRRSAGSPARVQAAPEYNERVRHGESWQWWLTIQTDPGSPWSRGHTSHLATHSHWSWPGLWFCVGSSETLFRLTRTVIVLPRLDILVSTDWAKHSIVTLETGKPLKQICYYCPCSVEGLSWCKGKEIFRNPEVPTNLFRWDHIRSLVTVAALRLEMVRRLRHTFWPGLAPLHRPS